MVAGQGQLSSASALAHQILLVEDDPQSAEFLRDLLQARGYSVSVARDGGQAHATFSMRKPDFVILDLILPGESGFEICQRFKQAEKAVPVLVLTAIDMQEARDLAARVGADGYMTKPFDPEQLLAKIQDVAESVWQATHTGQPREAGRVRFSCRCGKRFKVSGAHRGKSLTCPRCGDPVVVPRQS